MQEAYICLNIFSHMLFSISSLPFTWLQHELSLTSYSILSSDIRPTEASIDCQKSTLFLNSATGCTIKLWQFTLSISENNSLSYCSV